MKLFDTEVEPASPPLARKTRKQRPELDRESQESGEATAVPPRLLRPLLPLGGSAECADESGASFESQESERAAQTSSFPGSMPS